MSGKPQAAAPNRPATAKPAAARPSGSSARPAAKSNPATPASPGTPTSGRPTTGKPTSPQKSATGDQDDPFEVDTSALRQALKLSPRPTKSRTLEVTCPMCETSGFMPPSEAGKEVHCCNPDCMVPVFKTQRPQVEEAPVEETRTNGWLLYGGGLGALAAISAAVWFFVLAPQKPDVVETPDIPVPETPIQDLNLTPENRIVQATDAPPATPSEIRTRALAAIVDRARQRDRNRSPDYGTQLAAEAFADAGNLTKAGEQIRRLQGSAAQAPYLQIQPLVEVGWQQLAANKPQDAQATVTTALTKSRNAPRSIRKTLDALTSLAALCVMTGNTKEAQELITREQDLTQRGRLSALWRAAIDSQSFQIDQEARAPWHRIMPEPMRLAVIESLVAHGQVDAAEELISTGENVASIATCQAAWAGRLTQNASAQSLERVAEGLKKLKGGPAAEVQTWAAVAFSALLKKNQELATAALERAVVASGNLKAPAPVALPNLRAIHGSEGKPHVGLPNPAPVQAASQAFASLAIAQMEAGQKDAGWASFQQAVRQAQGMAPSPALTQELLTACETQESSLRAQLNQTLNLGSSEQRIGTEFARYRRQCGKLHAEAQRRLDLQVAILNAALDAGLFQETWELVKEQSQSSDLQARDPFFTTSLPSRLLSLAEARTLPDLASEVRSAAGDQRIEVDPLDRVESRATAALADGNFSQSSDIVEQAYRSQIGKKQPDRIDEITLRICARAQTAVPPKEMIPFIKNLADVVIQEDAFLQLAGYTMQHNTAAELWTISESSRELDALDYVSLFRGFVGGFMAAPAPAPSVPAADQK